MIDSSMPLKSGKSSPPNSLVYKNDKLNLQKDQGKPGDRYKDFTGDLEFEEDKDSAAGEMTLERKLKDFQLIERSIANVGCHSTTKEKCKGKKPKKPSFGEKYPRGASNAAPPSGNGSISDATATGFLLLGTNPKSLPDEWLYRMLTWLF